MFTVTIHTISPTPITQTCPCIMQRLIKAMKFAQNIGSSNKYQQSMNKKNAIPRKPQFYNINVGCKEGNIYMGPHVFLMQASLQPHTVRLYLNLYMMEGKQLTTTLIKFYVSL